MSEFKTFLGETLALIDEHFSKGGRPLSERPMKAALFIVEHLLVSIEGDTKDNYLTKPWFGELLKSVVDWYEARYGERRIRVEEMRTSGLVHYFGCPMLFRLPLHPHEPGEDGTTWVRFPREVLEGERPLTWLESAPPLENAKEKRRTVLEKAIRQTATLLRSIYNDINTADFNEPNHRSLATAVMRHLEKAAVDAATDDANARALAVWELQMACEKTIKAYLAQKGVKYPATHGLRLLHKLTAGMDDFAEAKRAIAVLPTETRVIAWRYSELPSPTPTEFLRMYNAALRLCAIYASRMERRFVFNNFAVQVKRPPWRL